MDAVYVIQQTQTKSEQDYIIFWKLKQKQLTQEQNLTFKTLYIIINIIFHVNT